jgi:hypothetical protein
MPILYVYDSTCTNISGALCNWTVPSTVSSVVFELWGGGGGGGGGVCNCDCCSVTMGGSGGGYSMKTVSVTPGDTYVLCAGNPGVGENGGSYGAATGGVNVPGRAGGTSYVTGTNVPASFCATGGTGGLSNGIYSCYHGCGCQGPEGGTGYNGDLNQTGGPAVTGSSGGIITPYSIYTMGGAAAGPGGGAGGFLGSTCCYASAAYNYDMHGSVPGGGGSGHRVGTETSNPGTNCNCNTSFSGRGAPGLVKVTW